MKRRFRDILLPKSGSKVSLIRSILTGSFYRVSDMRSDTSLADIKTQIDTMRALARDSQVSTALSYYATDATIVNTKGEIIWATANDKKYEDVAEIINNLFRRWKLNSYARDHLLELATIGNLYIPTTSFYRESARPNSREVQVAIDNNTIKDDKFDIIPSNKILPEEIIHLWYQGVPQGFVYQNQGDMWSDHTIFPEEAVIHFSLGGLLGNYTIDGTDDDKKAITYDIQFAQPLMDKAVQPTQTLSLLEDALVLASLSRIVRFVNVECGNAEEEEITDILQRMKDAIEQQFSLNTANGDAQSFVNPQSPNNLIYVPRVNGQDAVSITDMNMAESSEQDSKLLQYYQDKKLSVLGVPKEAMNFSSNEGLGGAGSVLSQRSSLYANSLQRLETAYIEGWTHAINTYFRQRGMSGYVDTFTLHMTPIVTQLSTVTFEKRDSAISQANSLITLLKDLGVDDRAQYSEALKEILSEALPQTGGAATTWKFNLDKGEQGGGGI